MTSRVDVRALEGGGGLHDLADGHVCSMISHRDICVLHNLACVRLARGGGY